MGMGDGSAFARGKIMRGSSRIIARKALEFPSEMECYIGDYSHRTSRMERGSTPTQESLLIKT